MEAKKINLIKRLAILLLVHSLCSSSLALAESLTFEASQQIVLTENTSSLLFNESNLRSETECSIRCMARNCSLATMNEASRQCQLIVLKDASAVFGPPGTHVRRVLGAEAGDRVWKMPGFEQQLRSLQTSFEKLVFNYTSTGRTGTVQTTRISVTGCYKIEAKGASGGTSLYMILGSNTLYRAPGGRGAKMVGNFNLTAGTELSIVVGQRGGDVSQGAPYTLGSGGGGGSFVYIDSSNTLLIAAGGGGGAGGSIIGNCSRLEGNVGSISTSGGITPCWNNYFCAYRGYGGFNGHSGTVNESSASGNNSFGGAGAGWLSKSSVAQRTSEDATGGGSRADSWIGGLSGSSNSDAVGGFGGGGGGGGGGNCGGSGGGGGYSGGGAATFCCNAGGGGGSFCSGINCTATVADYAESYYGSVVIQIC